MPNTQAVSVPITTTPVVDVVAMTVDQFKKALPDKVKKSVNQSTIDQITNLLANPDLFEQYRDGLLGYTSVMADGRFKVENYVSAVKYVTHKLMGGTNLDSFTKTFPDKMNDWISRGIQSKDIASYVTAYNKSKLVNLIFEQTLVPTYVLNADIHQKAVNVLAELMVSAQSEKVRSDSANALLTHLKVPEATKIQLDIGISDSGGVIAALREETQRLAAAQRLAIQSGASSALGIAHSKLTIDQDVSDV